MLAAAENVSAVSVSDREDLPPCVVGIARDDFSVPVVDRNDVSLQILLEVKRLVVIDDAADAVLVIVERNKRVIAPFFPEDFCPVKRVSVPHAAYRLACADAVCVVGILDIVKGLELSALFPRQRMTEIIRRIPLCVIGDAQSVVTGQQILPHSVAVGVSDAVLALDISVVVIRHRINNRVIDGLGEQLPQRVVGVFRNAFKGVCDLCDALFGVVLIPERSAARQYDLTCQLGGIVSGKLSFRRLFSHLQKKKLPVILFLIVCDMQFHDHVVMFEGDIINLTR